MKTMKYLLGMLLCMSIGLTFIACGNDDKEEGVHNIVGTWRYVDHTGYLQITFYEDGTGYHVEGDVIGDHDLSERDWFKWTIVGNELHIVSLSNDLEDSRTPFKFVDKDHIQVEVNEGGTKWRTFTRV